jgi:hypothetical protein
MVEREKRLQYTLSTAHHEWKEKGIKNREKKVE